MFERVTRIAIVALAAIGLTACGINSVPTKEEAAKAQWGNVESALQKRADLIPNLIRTVEAAAIAERDILQRVTDARSRAMSINVTTDDLSNPETFQAFNESQNELTQALGQFRTVVENYPQLQSIPQFRDLMSAMEGVENQISTERMRYNEKAQDYNTEIRTFPSTIAANVIYGSDPMQYFEAAEGADQPVEANFDAITGGAQGSASAPASNDNSASNQPAAATN
ncbi:LemA family protein [Paraurantiacibacter namhicola]|uniref:LemA family protein n=1 Tax=Paraurantiacibacter namhicola TaxID=645517 RepID=A0A1C7DAC5_9SPHN|nr:LemA family protein [Paraurantiacibacter namhicola]ANU08398.1 LemA family protein [Paraurantiacibacter namhicola]